LFAISINLFGSSHKIMCPEFIPSGLSVVFRHTIIFLFKKEPSSCMPPESVITNLQSFKIFINSSCCNAGIASTYFNVLDCSKIYGLG